MKLRPIALAASFLLATPGLAAAWVPTQIDAQGVLRDAAGDLVDLPDATIVFRLYDAESAGALLWSETQTDVPIVMGVFDTLLPGNALTELPSNVQAKLAIGAPLWLSIQLENQDELPRTALVSVPYAFTSNRALVASGLDCSGCIDASDINTSTFTAQHLGYAPGAGDLIDATTVGGALAQLDGFLADHIANADAHHPADSSGIAIKPDSVTIGTTSTKLEDGQLDLGPGTADALTAAHVATLTGGGNADALHKHTAQSITGGMGGGSCHTFYGASLPTCPSGYSQAQTGIAVVPEGVSSTGVNLGIGAPICASVTPSVGGQYAQWLGAYNGNTGIYTGQVMCSVCCPAAQDEIAGCFSQYFSQTAAADHTTCNYTYETISYAHTSAPGRTYHFKRIELWVVGNGFSPTSSNWDIKIVDSSTGAVLARVPGFVQRRASTYVGMCAYGGSFWPYLLQGTIDLTLTSTKTLTITVVDATTGANVFSTYTNGSNAAGIFSSGMNLTGCIETTP